MNIKSVGESNPKNIVPVQSKTVPNVTKGNQNPSSNKLTPIDKLDISPSAHKLMNIKNKINQGFYNKDEIIKTTSLKIYQKHLK